MKRIRIVQLLLMGVATEARIRTLDATFASVALARETGGTARSSAPLHLCRLALQDEVGQRVEHSAPASLRARQDRRPCSQFGGKHG